MATTQKTKALFREEGLMFQEGTPAPPLSWLCIDLLGYTILPLKLTWIAKIPSFLL